MVFVVQCCHRLYALTLNSNLGWAQLNGSSVALVRGHACGCNPPWAPIVLDHLESGYQSFWSRYPFAHLKIVEDQTSSHLTWLYLIMFTVLQNRSFLKTRVHKHTFSINHQSNDFITHHAASRKLKCTLGRK